MPEEKQPKRVNVQAIPRTEGDGVVHPVYRIAEDLIARFHPALADGVLAIVWNTGWKPDADDKLKLGCAKRATDLERELMGADLIIQLNYGVWNNAGFSELQQRALIDHELCHLDVAKDEDGEDVVDERGRIVFRTVKHDLEEFKAVVDRWGCWKAEIEDFARAAIRKVEAAKPAQASDVTA